VQDQAASVTFREKEMSNEASGQFEGIHVALVTPMTADQEVDHETLGSMIEYLIGQGIHGIIPLGSTGEYYALSPEERRDVVAETIQAVGGRAKVLVGTNAGSTRDVVAYARQAEKLGADGILLAAPYYSLPTPAELIEHVCSVDGAVGIPIMLYNYPGRTGVDMTPEVVQRLAELDNVRYIKESTGDLSRIGEIIRRCGTKMLVFCGCDTLAIEAFDAGAIGWVGGVVNVIPRLHVELYNMAAEAAGKGAKLKDNPEAVALFERMRPLLELMENGGKYTQFVKAGCGLMGHPVGPPRQPLLPASRDELAVLQQALSACM